MVVAALAAVGATAGTAPIVAGPIEAVEAAPIATLIVSCRLAPASCTKLTISLTGNGSGQVVTTATLGGAPDGLIDCKRSANTTQGVCSHTYYVGLGKSKTVFLRETPANGSEACYGNGCTTQSNAMSVTFGPGQTLTKSFQFKLLIASLPPPPTPIPTPTTTPTPTPTATPKATPTKPPVAATTTPGHSSAASTAPATALAASPSPNDSAAPADSPSATDTAAPSTQPAASASAGPSSPSSPASSGGTDLGPLAIAVVVAGLVIAGAVYAGLRRRPSARP
ncbi:MAG: hypothetical protein HY263_10575 [Chloroflexi bacterium]|nr:hypothetical protein [Chloroflexota bacterium]